MPLFSWLLERMTAPGNPGAPRRGLPAQRFRPHLEVLEGRTVPTTFYAATASDLIGDIQAANQQGGANTIVLTAPAGSSYAMTAANNTTDGSTALPLITSGDNLTIRTGNGAAAPGYGDVLDAGKNGRLFDVAAGGSLALQNVTLQNGFMYTFGQTNWQGGAIRNHGTLALSQVMVQNCSVAGYPGFGSAAAGGGGIWSDGSLSVESCGFSGNSAKGSDNPGGGRNGGNAYGGAICIAGGTAAINGSSFVANAAMGGGTHGAPGTNYYGGAAYGGAVYVAAGKVTMSADVVGSPTGTSNRNLGNVAQGGPGSLSSSSTLGYGYGGGICVAGGSVTLTSDAIEYNGAAATGVNGGVEPAPVYSGHGGGVFVAPGASASIDAFTLAHTILNKSFRSVNIDGTYTLLK